MARPLPAIVDPFLKNEEGVELRRYKDVAGRPTIGIGHLLKPGEVFPALMTLQQAYDLLNKDVAKVAAFIEQHVKVELNDNQFAALISFTFNLGEGALLSSTLLRMLNKGAYAVAADEFHKWDKAHLNGQIVEVKALKERRAREELLFLTAVPTEVNAA